MKRTGKLFLVAFIQILIATTLYFTGVNSLKTEKISLYPSDPTNWEETDESYLLNGKIYYPVNYNPQEKYPAVLMFHGVTRNLNDHEYFANQLSSRGIVSICIDFHGHGESGGEFPFNDGTLYNDTFGDAYGVYRYIQALDFVDREKILAYGISLGGGAALYLALSGIVPKFLVWYPGIAYQWGTTELYKYNGSDYSPEFEGLILAGTEDECGRCSPDFVQIFDENNPSVDVQWLEGAKHTDSDFFLECVERSLIWIEDLWNLPSPSRIIGYYTAGYVGLGLMAIFLLIDVVIMIRLKVKKEKNRKE